MTCDPLTCYELNERIAIMQESRVVHFIPDAITSECRTCEKRDGRTKISILKLLRENEKK